MFIENRLDRKPTKIYFSKGGEGVGGGGVGAMFEIGLKTHLLFAKREDHMHYLFENEEGTSIRDVMCISYLKLEKDTSVFKD